MRCSTRLLLTECPTHNKLSEGFSAGSGIRKGWFSNTSFTTGLKPLPTFRPDALVFFRAKKTRAVTLYSGMTGTDYLYVANGVVYGKYIGQ